MKLRASNSASRTSTRDAIRKPMFAASTLRMSPRPRESALFLASRRQTERLSLGERERLEPGRDRGEAVEQRRRMRRELAAGFGAAGAGACEMSPRKA